jgi:pyruvate-ferredoxin/flavodoxin oxidoreductase
MAARSTGFGLIASNSVQEAHDFALISQAATLEARIPFVHFFDGFRTSAEVNKISQLSDEEIRAMIDDELVQAHRGRALSPDRPFIRGTAQNPDAFFQARRLPTPYRLAQRSFRKPWINLPVWLAEIITCSITWATRRLSVWS